MNKQITYNPRPDEINVDWEHLGKGIFENNLKELNMYLEQGWRVVSVNSMGGAGITSTAYSLVIIEKK